MLSRVTFTNSKEDKKYDILRIYDDYNSTISHNLERNIRLTIKKKNLCKREWKPDFDYSHSYYAAHSSWDKDSYAIMFSGGFDSLSLALRHLEKGERVFLLSIGFSDEQISSSLEVKLLKSIYGEAVIGPIKLFDQIYVDGESTSGLTQQPFTAFYATHMPDAVRNSIKALECAYIMNDDAISFQNELKAIYNNAMKCHTPGRPYPPIKFPLTKVSHEENIEYVSMIEKKHNVIFPALSSIIVDCSKYVGKENDLYTIIGSENEEKSNKKCNIHGYLIIEKDLSPRKREKAMEKIKCKIKATKNNGNISKVQG